MEDVDAAEEAGDRPGLQGQGGSSRGQGVWEVDDAAESEIAHEDVLQEIAAGRQKTLDRFVSRPPAATMQSASL